MGWNEFHARKHVIESVLDHAEHTGQSTIPFEEIPHVRTAFRDRAELISALHAKRTTLLHGYAEIEAFDSGDDLPSDITGAAQHRFERNHPVLHRLLSRQRSGGTVDRGDQYRTRTAFAPHDATEQCTGKLRSLHGCRIMRRLAAHPAT